MTCNSRLANIMTRKIQEFKVNGGKTKVFESTGKPIMAERILTEKSYKAVHTKMHDPLHHHKTAV